MTHPTWEQLNDVSDGVQPSADTTAHLQHCLSCRQTVAALSAQRDAARALPDESIPPDDLWPSIRDTIQARGVRRRHVAPLRWATRTNLLAAAAALIVITSTATIVAVKGALDVGDAAPGAATMAIVPAAWQATEQGYLETVEDLRLQLDAQRDVLTPETVVTVERLLSTVDAAIDEARAALARDPANQTIAELLASNYRQKIELLRRVTQMASS